MKNKNTAHNIETIKLDVLEQLSILLEHQIDNNNFSKNISVLEQKKTEQITNIFESISANQEIQKNQIKLNINYFNNINNALKILHTLQNKNTNENIKRLKENLFKLNNIFDKLAFEHNNATHDALTGLYNKRYFDTVINDEINRAERRNGKISILMIDLDNFKTINDSYGHVVGDLVLKHIANIILKQIRQSDLAARIGGDEFAAILIETELNQACNIAERIRQQIKDPCLTTPYGDKFCTSVSIGISNFPNDAKDAIGLMRNADIALYNAKDQGKNNVFMSKN
jgi:diguanylate cyclase (GGDEF)-like protein